MSFVLGYESLIWSYIMGCTPCDMVLQAVRNSESFLFIRFFYLGVCRGYWQISSAVWPISQKGVVVLKLMKDSSWREARLRQIPAGIFSRALLLVNPMITVFLEYLSCSICYQMDSQMDMVTNFTHKMCCILQTSHLSLRQVKTVIMPQQFLCLYKIYKIDCQQVFFVMKIIKQGVETVYIWS